MTVTTETTGRSSGLIATFIARLATLPRGDLAVLRRNAGNTVGDSRGAAPVFYRLLPQAVSGGPEEEIFFLAATLYGLNKYSLQGDMGTTLRLVKQKTGSDNIDRRMAVLLDSEFGRVDGYRPGGGELAYRLRQCIRLASGQAVGVDWVELIGDLYRWSHPDKIAQKKWARSYFTGTAVTEASPENKEGKDNVS